jgi:hypothetical protein
MSSLSYIKTITLTIFVIFFTLKSNAQEGIVSIEQDEKIERLLKERNRLLKSGELKTYYTIQVISGELKTARETLKACKSKFSDFKSDVVYETPNYKVWVGEFRNKLDADRALVTISEEHEGAFVIKPKNKKK